MKYYSKDSKRETRTNKFAEINEVIGRYINLQKAI